MMFLDFFPPVFDDGCFLKLLLILDGCSWQSHLCTVFATISYRELLILGVHSCTTLNAVLLLIPSHCRFCSGLCILSAFWQRCIFLLQAILLFLLDLPSKLVNHSPMEFSLRSWTGLRLSIRMRILCFPTSGVLQ